MGETRFRPRLFSFLFAVLGACFLLLPGHAALAKVHNVSGWAWSGTTGWISTSCEDAKPGFPSGDCAPGNGWYGLNMDSAGTLYGWAWSTSAGWLCFGATCTATNSPPTGTPVLDHYCPSHTPCARYDASDSELHGWAYIVSETDGVNYNGWVSLNCTDVGTNTASPHNCGSSDYAVGYDDPTGQFSRAGARYSYGWNAGNSNQNGSGWMQFACGFPRPCGGADGDWGVQTDWEQPGWTTVDQPEGVYSPPPLPSVGLNQSAVNLIFRNFSAPANSVLSCYLRVSDGTYRQIGFPINSRTSSQSVTETYTLSTTDPAADASGDALDWVFASPPGPPAYGCQVIGTPSIQKTVVDVIAIHPSTWTFQSGGGSLQADSNRAKYCLDGNLGVDPTRAYFGNTVQCDTDGDLAFTMLKAKGLKVETFCRDNVDNDANGGTDFNGTCNAAIPITSSDRTCRGITYLCLSHTALPCSGSCPAPQP